MRLLAAALVCAASAVTTAQGRSQGECSVTPDSEHELLEPLVYQNVALDGRDTSLDDAGPELCAEESHRRLVGPAEARTGRLAALL